MNSEFPKLINLFERASAEELNKPDMALNLQIADQMNTKRTEWVLHSCIEGIEYFRELLRSTHLKTIELTMSLLETCVKNCNIQFHRYINNRNLMPIIMDLLKRKRKKLSFVEKLAGIYESDGWRQIENRVLALIQLWADTFMMEEDVFPCFMRAYRELRKEQIKFPPRDPNERFMIKFEGEPSPAFELAEMKQQLPLEIEDDISDEPKLLRTDIESLKRAIPELEEIILNARHMKELQDSYIKELVRKCRAAQKKLIEVVSFQTSHECGSQEAEELFEIMEFVNEKMQSFRAAARLIREGAEKTRVKEALEINQDEDFLEIQASPLEKLDKYEYGTLKERVLEEHEESPVRGHEESYDLTSILFDGPEISSTEPAEEAPEGGLNTEISFDDFFQGIMDMPPASN